MVPPDTASSPSRSGRPVLLTGGQVQTITLGAGENSVRLVIQPLAGVPLDAPVALQLLAADGTRHAETRVTHGEAVDAGKGALFQIDLQPQEEGPALTLRASAVAAAGSTTPAATASYRIRFRREP